MTLSGRDSSGQALIEVVTALSAGAVGHQSLGVSAAGQ